MQHPLGFKKHPLEDTAWKTAVISVNFHQLETLQKTSNPVASKKYGTFLCFPGKKSICCAGSSQPFAAFVNYDQTQTMPRLPGCFQKKKRPTRPSVDVVGVFLTPPHL